MTAHLVSEQVVQDVLDRAATAHRRWGRDSLYWATASNDRRMSLLAEEAGEVARALNEGAAGKLADLHHLRLELVQVAAIAVTWIAAVDDGNA